MGEPGRPAFPEAKGAPKAPAALSSKGRPRIVDGCPVPPIIPESLGLSEEDLRGRHARRSRRRSSLRRYLTDGMETCPECGRLTDARQGQESRVCARCRVSQRWRPRVEALSQEVIRSSVRVSVLKSAIEKMDEALRDGDDPGLLFEQAMEWHDDEVDTLTELVMAARDAMETLGRAKQYPEIARLLKAVQFLGPRWG